MLLENWLNQCLGYRRCQSLCSAQCLSSILRLYQPRLIHCAEVLLGLLWTVWRRVCVEDLDHRSGWRERLCYGWKALVPTWQTVEEAKYLKNGLSQEQQTKNIVCLITSWGSSSSWQFYWSCLDWVWSWLQNPPAETRFDKQTATVKREFYAPTHDAL